MSATLSEIVGATVSLTAAASSDEFKGCCPFHAEVTPSFYVNDRFGFWHCFGCGRHGDDDGWTAARQEAEAMLDFCKSALGLEA